MRQPRWGASQVRPDSFPIHRRRFPNPDAVGLPDSVKVNPLMFSGIRLSAEQAESVVRIATAFARVRDSVLATVAPGVRRNAEWDAVTRERMTPFVDQQTRAYRAVLTTSQQAVFDSNTSRIVEEWRRGPQQGRAWRVKAAPEPPPGSGRRGGITRSRTSSGGLR
jgi:hypothetical protein